MNRRLAAIAVAVLALLVNVGPVAARAEPTSTSVALATYRAHELVALQKLFDLQDAIPADLARKDLDAITSDSLRFQKLGAAENKWYAARHPASTCFSALFNAGESMWAAAERTGYYFHRLAIGYASAASPAALWSNRLNDRLKRFNEVVRATHC